MVKKLLSFYFLLFVSLLSFSQEAYYSDVNLTLTGIQLKAALATKITTTHTNKLDYTPGVWNASKITDVNPNNSGQVTLIYGWENGSDGDITNDKFRDSNLQDSGNGDSFRWNREHVYSKSLANPSFTTDNPGPGTDAHNLRPADRTRNSTRNNFKFGEGSGNSGFSSVTYNGPSGPNTNAWFPGDEWKGDVARMMMYMYLRYGDQCLPSGVGVGNSSLTPDDMIDLFLKWNVEDPVSDLEKVRNAHHGDVTNTDAQGNRNPFIDNPYLATRIWGGDSAQDLWGIYTSSDTQAPTTPTNVVAANQTTTTIDVSWTASTDNVAVTGYNVYVNSVLTSQTASTTIQITGLMPNTSYAIEIEAKDLINNKSAKSTAINSTTATDTTAPSVPANIVTSNISGTTFKIAWDAATDNTAVAGYDVFVDATFKATTTELNYTVTTGLSVSTTYAVTVLAKDAADNKSAQSTAVNVTTTDGASTGVSELFISEYVEGDGGVNKAIEIVNLTGTTVSLAGYELKLERNGAAVWTTPLALDSGTVKDITPGDVFVIGNGDNSDPILQLKTVSNTVGEVDLVQPSNNDTSFGQPVNFNGDDAVGLFKNGVLIDIVGVFGSSASFAENVTLIRKPTISSPSNTYDANEWKDTGLINDFSNIGSHTSTLSVEKIDNNLFKLYPNPLNGSNLNIVNTSSIQIKALKIYTINGREVISIANPTASVNLNGLHNGLYIVKLISDKGTSIQKLIKN